MAKDKKIVMQITAPDTVIFKYRTSIKAEIQPIKSGKYNCFLRTSANGGLSADYAIFADAERVAVQYIADIYNDRIYFEKKVCY